MWKWIVGGCLGLILIVCIAMYIGYQKVKTYASAGPLVAVNIAATPHRVFVALSDADSLKTWRLDGTVFRATKHGPLVVGDTLAGDASNRNNRMIWIVSAISPDTMIGYDGIMRDNGQKVFTRRDAVVGIGDSTRVVIDFATPVMDTISSHRENAGPVSGGVLDVAMTAMMGGMRMQFEEELKRLKTHIEGRPVSPTKVKP